MTNYKLIMNPAAGRGKAGAFALRAFERFRSQGVTFSAEQTRNPGDAGRIARAALPDHDVIIAVGGDGTVNEVIQGMIFSDRPLGIIPSGSGNDLIKALGIPNNIEQAVEIIMQGKTKRIDAGIMNRRYFLNAVGIGFDAAVNRASYAVGRSRRGLLLYLCALARTLGRYDPVPMTVTLNNRTESGALFLLTAGNGTTVGGGFRLTPTAKLDDGLLDVTRIRPIGLLPLLWHLPKVFLGTIDRVPQYVTTERTARIIVESSEPVPVHLDGEVWPDGERRFEIGIVPKALSVIGNWNEAGPAARSMNECTSR
jgi:diacylglycerol kinase (ATP)